VKRLACLTLLAAVAVPAPAAAYRISHGVVPQPTLRYYVGLSDWRRPFGRVVRELNRKHVGVRLVKAQIPEQASIQIGRLNHRCGYPGVNGATQTLSGGYAAIYLPYGCHGAIASIIAAHELGHALGLKHDNRRCALLNSTAGRKGIPNHCQGGHYDWLRHPFRADDLRGLRRLYRNTAPRARLRVARRSGRSVTFSISATDRQRNISEVRIEFGDGSAATGYRAGQVPHSHTYSEPGTYRARLTVTDFYSRRASSAVTVTVGQGQ
jgi:hypothetical protein